MEFSQLIGLVLISHKKGDRNLVNNYRPISLTCIICKVLEKLIHHSLYTLLESSQVLHHSQFGFRHKHSTTLLLATVVDDWARSLDSHQSVHSIFILLFFQFWNMPFHHGLHILRETLIVLNWSNQREHVGSVVVNMFLHCILGLSLLLNVVISYIGVPYQFVDNIWVYYFCLRSFIV